MAAVPDSIRWLLWEVDPDRIDTERHGDYLIARVIEFGGLAEVRWLLAAYGEDRVHRFLRDVGHVELTPRTLAFWRAFFDAKEETWVDRRASRPLNSAPWHG